METLKNLAENYSPTESWTDSEWTSFNEWLHSMLKMGPVTVTFKKKDGSTRVMECTLDPKLLPEPVLKETKDRKKSSNALAVYDLESQGWRSFILKNVTRVNFKI